MFLNFHRYRVQCVGNYYVFTVTKHDYFLGETVSNSFFSLHVLESFHKHIATTDIMKQHFDWAIKTSPHVAVCKNKCGISLYSV